MVIQLRVELGREHLGILHFWTAYGAADALCPTCADAHLWV